MQSSCSLAAPNDRLAKEWLWWGMLWNVGVEQGNFPAASLWPWLASCAPHARLPRGCRQWTWRKLLCLAVMASAAGLQLFTWLIRCVFIYLPHGARLSGVPYHTASALSRRPCTSDVLLCYSGPWCGECGQPLAPQHRHGNGLRFAHPHPGARAVSIVVSVTFMSTSVSAYIHT